MSRITALVPVCSDSYSQHIEYTEFPSVKFATFIYVIETCHKSIISSNI